LEHILIEYEDTFNSSLDDFGVIFSNFLNKVLYFEKWGWLVVIVVCVELIF